VFCCIPGHTGLPGNEAADVAKVVAVHRTLISDGTVGSDIYSFLHHTCLSSWRDGIMLRKTNCAW
jgi:hypothetical protein